MHYFVSLALLLTLLGCGQPVRQSNIPSIPDHLEWDVSKNRDAAAFPWFDFDLNYGAIDETTHLVFKFDPKRKFEGDVELITFSRANDTAPLLQTFHLNLPSQSAAEVIETLKSLAAEWDLETNRLDQATEQILSGTDYRGIILYERNMPTIDVSLHSSFNSQRPYFIHIAWSWSDEPKQIGEREDSAQANAKSTTSHRHSLP